MTPPRGDYIRKNREESPELAHDEATRMPLRDFMPDQNMRWFIGYGSVIQATVPVYSEV